MDHLQNHTDHSKSSFIASKPSLISSKPSQITPKHSLITSKPSGINPKLSLITPNPHWSLPNSHRSTPNHTDHPKPSPITPNHANPRPQFGASFCLTPSVGSGEAPAAPSPHGSHIPHFAARMTLAGRASRSRWGGKSLHAERWGQTSAVSPVPSTHCQHGATPNQPFYPPKPQRGEAAAPTLSDHSTPVHPKTFPTGTETPKLPGFGVGGGTNTPRGRWGGSATMGPLRGRAGGPALLPRHNRGGHSCALCGRPRPLPCGPPRIMEPLCVLGWPRTLWPAKSRGLSGRTEPSKGRGGAVRAAGRAWAGIGLARPPRPAAMPGLGMGFWQPRWEVGVEQPLLVPGLKACPCSWGVSWGISRWECH